MLQLCGAPREGPGSPRWCGNFLSSHCRKLLRVMPKGDAFLVMLDRADMLDTESLKFWNGW